MYFAPLTLYDKAVYRYVCCHWCFVLYACDTGCVLGEVGCHLKLLVGHGELSFLKIWLWRDLQVSGETEQSQKRKEWNRGLPCIAGLDSSPLLSPIPSSPSVMDQMLGWVARPEVLPSPSVCLCKRRSRERERGELFLTQASCRRRKNERLF